MSSTTATSLLKTLPRKPFCGVIAPDVDFQCSTSSITTSEANKQLVTKH